MEVKLFDIDLLIVRYVENTATVNELYRLWKWTEALSENHEYFVKQCNILYNCKDKNHDFSSVEGFENMRNRLDIVNTRSDLNNIKNLPLSNQLDGKNNKSVSKIIKSLVLLAISTAVAASTLVHVFDVELFPDTNTNIYISKNNVKSSKSQKKTNQDTKQIVETISELPVEPVNNQKTEIASNHSFENHDVTGKAFTALTKKGDEISEHVIQVENKQTIRNTMQFSNSPLSEVVPEIEKAYGRTIKIKNIDAEKYMLNAQISDQNFQEVLTMFEVVFDITYYEKNGVIYLDGEEACE